MRRSWILAALVLGIGAMVAVVLAFRLTEDGSRRTSPVEWAGSVCASLSTWRSSITSLAGVSDGPLTPESLRTKLDTARASTEQLGTELRALGPPDLDSGDEVEAALDDIAAGLERSFASLGEAAETAARADTQGEFLRALADLGDDFQRLLDEVGEAVSVFRSASLFGEASAELELAFADAHDCEELRAES